MVNSRKMARFFLIGILSLLFVLPTASYAQGTVPTLDKNELKQLHYQIFNLVSEDKESEIVNLELYKKYSKIFEQYPDLKEQYEKELDVNDPEKLNNESKVVVKGSKTFHITEDGSFSVVTNTVTGATPVADRITPSAVLQDTGAQTYTAKNGATVTNNARHDIWGAYKSAELHFTTTYKVSSTSVNIISTSSAGTKAIFPAAVGSISSTIQGNNTKTASAIGTYGTSTTCPSGWGTCASRSIDMKTTIAIQYAGSGNVTYTARTVVTG